MVKINKQLVSSSIASKVTSKGTNPKTHIVIHETANTGKGANAKAHANLQSNGNSRQASWHYTCGSDGIYQSFSDNARCWHAGNSFYNNNSIGIEICVNSDGNYKKAVDNAIELVKYLMKKYGIPSKNVVQHNTASGKDCPHFMRAGSKGITWSQFKKRLTGSSSVTTSKPSTSKPSKKPTSKGKANYNTKSIVTFLQSINQPYSLSHRKKLASYYNVKNYKGQASLNLQLLDLLKKDYKKRGKLRTSKPKPTTTTKAKPKANLKVDGYMGTQTIKALQRYFGTTVDGYISKPSNVIKALQKLLKVTQDGYFGPKTITALQKRFNMKIVDGVISKPSNVIKELQRRLNKGKL